jgi:signal transduction histidine kinase
VNVLVDVTARRRAEASLRATAEALATSNAVKDEFLGLVSHELRTPVTTIYGNAQLLRDRGATLPEAQREDMIADVAEDSDRLLAIVENLLLLSRLQSGVRPETEPQVLVHVVRQEVGAFGRRHPEIEIRLGQIPADHIIVEADRTHLVVLLQNLLSNARKYGLGEPVDVCIEADAGEARVLVQDRGLGFGASDPESLFMPFFRTHEAQQAANGVGLGLPVCDRIIRALGGRMWAGAREGGGSEFGFAIPLAPAPLATD